MNEILGIFSLLAFAAVVGIRHGFDLDHIAAITDITSSQKNTYLGLIYAILYALGHGVMVIILGILLLVIGQSLPERLDAIFGKFVGVTLIFLGLYVLYSVLKDGKNFRLKSRWMLVFDAIQYGYHKLLHNFKASHYHPKIKEEKYAPHTTFVIGMIHGMGAETPTQLGAFLVLLGIGGGVRAIFFLIFFVLGIFISNLGVVAFTLYGYGLLRNKKAIRNQGLYIAIGYITAIFSIVLGILFLI